MLSPILKQSPSRERSPFSSPFSNVQVAPIAARRSSLEERRRPAAKFDTRGLPKPAVHVHEDDAEDSGEDDEEEDEEEDDNDDERDGDGELDDEDEDGDDAGETSPLLPIFSAAHLGISA